MKPQGVSIVICCHNGASRLRETVRHIAVQEVPSHIPWEVILIDNGSTDASAAVASAEWARHKAPVSFRIVEEPTVGLNHARARGFREAWFEYVIMCDDDNWLADDYVASAFDIMSERDNIGALGGCGKLVFEMDPPVPELCYIFAAGAQACSSGKVEGNKLYGAGCVVRYSAYQKLLRNGFKSLLTDRMGAALTSGGDYELCFALAIVGYDIWYDGRLRFYHFITRERLTWEYLMKYAHESSKSFNVISSYKMVVTNGRMSHAPWLALLKNFLSCCRIFFGITIERVINTQSDVKKPLYFRQVIFAHKLMAYFVKFRDMVDAHKEILTFQHSCRPMQHLLKPTAAKDLMPSLRISFFSKPFRQLP